MRSKKTNFAMYIETCCTLTNFNIVYCKAPLWKEDQEIYIGFITQIK
jgi:hypothetical protein